jgi:acetyl-CoA acyltransferase
LHQVHAGTVARSLGVFALSFDRSSTNMPNAVLVDGVRTPVGKGKPGGALATVHPVDLLAQTIASLVKRTELDPELVDDVIGGCVDQVGEQALNITRWAVLGAGLPETVPATTVDRQCGSSQQAVHFAAQGVMSGAYEIAIACGIESMSRVPMGSNVLPGSDPFGSRVAARYPQGLVPQGISAELIAQRWGLSRKDLDEFAAASHHKAAAAQSRGLFEPEIVPIETSAPDGETRLIREDETIRPSTTVEILADLPPAFYSPQMADRFPELSWQVTAGNSSPINDGASALLIMSEQRARSLGLRARARVHAFAVAAGDPILMLTAIIPATKTVLRRAGLTINEIDLFEVNEAFASVVLAWQRSMEVDTERVNVHGGAIALGHPLGASGVRIMTTLLNAMDAKGARWALQTMCEAGGLANAIILERL